MSEIVRVSFVLLLTLSSRVSYAVVIQGIALAHPSEVKFSSIERLSLKEGSGGCWHEYIMTKEQNNLKYQRNCSGTYQKKKNLKDIVAVNRVRINETIQYFLTDYKRYYRVLAKHMNQAKKLEANCMLPGGYRFIVQLKDGRKFEIPVSPCVGGLEYSQLEVRKLINKKARRAR